MPLSASLVLASSPGIGGRTVLHSLTERGKAMALTANPVATLKFDLIDESGSHGSMVLHVAGATTVAAARTAADAAAGLIAAITGCFVNSYTISYGSQETSTGLFAAAGSRVEHKGRFMYLRANGLHTMVEVPGILQELILSDGAIDGTNADVIAFSNSLVTGTTFVGPDGSDLVNLFAAYEAFRRSSKRQLPTRRLAV